MTLDSRMQEAQVLALREQGRMDEALTCLLDQYEAQVYRLCRAFLRDDTWAEDVAQQSLIRIWKGLAGFDGRSALSTWIYAIVRNRCHTALRAGRMLTVTDEVLAECADEQVQDPAAADSAALIAKLIDDLPDKYRTPIKLYYFEGESVGAVAERLDCPEGTVKTNLSRARTELRARLDAMGLGDWTLWN